MSVDLDGMTRHRDYWRRRYQTMHKRAKRAEAKIEKVREVLNGSPECDKYAEDGTITTCGWKITVLRLKEILDKEEENETL